MLLWYLRNDLKTFQHGYKSHSHKHHDSFLSWTHIFILSKNRPDLLWPYPVKDARSQRSSLLVSEWAQVEWWLEHRHGWLVKRQWAGSILGWVSRDEYQVLGSTSIPARLDTLVYWEPFSWLPSVCTTRNTVIRLGWSRIGLAVLILHAAGVGLTDRSAVISGRYDKYHSLQLQNYYAHFPPLQHTYIHANTIMRNWSWEWSWVSRHCMLAVAGGILCDRVKRPNGL